MSQELTRKFAKLSLQLEEAGAELAGMVPAGAAGGPVDIAPQVLLPRPGALLPPPLSCADLSLAVTRVEAQLALDQAMVPAGAAGGPVLDVAQALCQHKKKISDCDVCRIAKVNPLLAADLESQMQDLLKLLKEQADACQREQLMSTHATREVVCTWIQKAPKVGSSPKTSSVAQVAAIQANFRALEQERSPATLLPLFFVHWRKYLSRPSFAQLEHQMQQQQKLLQDLQQQLAAMAAAEAAAAEAAAEAAATKAAQEASALAEAHSKKPAFPIMLILSIGTLLLLLLAVSSWSFFSPPPAKATSIALMPPAKAESIGRSPTVCMPDGRCAGSPKSAL